MQNFKYGWILTRKDLTHHKVMFLWSTIFMLYMGGVLGVQILLGTSGISALQSAALDFVLILCTPLFGTDFSKRAFRSMKEDTYTQNLVYLRTLPIPAKAIVWGRIQQMAIQFCYNWTLLFTVLYIVGMHSQPGLTLIAYLSFALSWGGLGATLLSIYLYCEFSKTGKVYMWYSLGLVFSMMLLAIVNAWLGWNITRTFLQFAITYELASPLMWFLLILGIVCMSIAAQAVLRTLKHRNLV